MGKLLFTDNRLLSPELTMEEWADPMPLVLMGHRPSAAAITPTPPTAHEALPLVQLEEALLDLRSAERVSALY